MSFLAHVQKILLAAVSLLIIGCAVVLLLPKYRELSARKLQLAEMTRRIETQKQELSELKENQLRMDSDPEFVEMYLHKNGFVRPGEVIFSYENFNKK